MGIVRLFCFAVALTSQLAVAQPVSEPVPQSAVPAELTPPPPPVTEPSAADFSRELKVKMLTLQVEFWRGMQVYQGGKPLVEAMGDDTHLTAVLDEFPASKAARERARSYRIAGTVLFTAGVLPLAGGAGYLVYSSVPRSGFNGTSLGTGGVAALLVVMLLSAGAYACGAVFLNRALGLQLDAVNLYNASLLNRQLPPSEQRSPEDLTF